jgi:mannosyltransferase OCH1-like enzyme
MKGILRNPLILIIVCSLFFILSFLLCQIAGILFLYVLLPTGWNSAAHPHIFLANELINPRILSTDPIIPKVIHQTWKNQYLADYPGYNSHAYWKTYYPSYVVKIWTHEDMEALVRRDYSHLLTAYLALPYDIQRADIARYIILHHEGGFYADLDTFPGGANINDLRSFDVVVPFATDQRTLSTHFLGGVRNSSFFYSLATQFALKDSETNTNNHYYSYANRYLFSQYFYVFLSTGPFYFQKEFDRYFTGGDVQERALLLSHPISKKYFFHIGGRSWHQLDGKIISFFGDHAFTICISIILLAVVLTAFVYYYFHSLPELYTRTILWFQSRGKAISSHEGDFQDWDIEVAGGCSPKEV